MFPGRFPVTTFTTVTTNHRQSAVEAKMQKAQRGAYSRIGSCCCYQDSGKKIKSRRQNVPVTDQTEALLASTYKDPALISHHVEQGSHCSASMDMHRPLAICEVFCRRELPGLCTIES